MTAALVAWLFTGVEVGAATRGPSEGFLVEADLKQGSEVLLGRVLIEAGRTEWTTIAEAKVSRLKLEARATLLEADVVEVETRITGRDEQNGKMIVRLGERAEMTTAQMETSDTQSASTKRKEPLPSTSLGLKVLRVRYAL